MLHFGTHICVNNLSQHLFKHGLSSVRCQTIPDKKNTLMLKLNQIAKLIFHQKAFKISFQSDLPLYRCIQWKNLVYNLPVTKPLLFKRSVQWKEKCELFPIIHPHISKAIAYGIGMWVLIYHLIEAFEMLFRHNDVMTGGKHQSSALLALTRRIHWLL